MHELDTVPLLAEKGSYLVLAKYRPVVTAYKVLGVGEFQGLRDGVCPLQGVTGKSSPNGVNIMHTHVAIISNM